MGADTEARGGNTVHSILVADSNQARGQLLAQECTRLGMHAFTAAQGSAALEVSLAKVGYTAP